MIERTFPLVKSSILRIFFILNKVRKNRSEGILQKDFPFHARIMFENLTESLHVFFFIYFFLCYGLFEFSFFVFPHTTLHQHFSILLQCWEKKNRNAHKIRIENSLPHFFVLYFGKKKNIGMRFSEFFFAKKNVISLTNNRGTEQSQCWSRRMRESDAKPNGTVGTCDAPWISKQSRFSICFPQRCCLGGWKKCLWMYLNGKNEKEYIKKSNFLFFYWVRMEWEYKFYNKKKKKNSNFFLTP